MMAKKPNMEDRIVRLQKWSRAELVEEWVRLHGRPPPKCSSPQFMMRVISYRWQEEVYGGMSRSMEQLLADLIRRYKSDPENFAPQVRIKPGTRLQRTHKGQMHEVEVMPDGRFNYQGQSYRTLSMIARLITGSNWNRYAFFGILKKGKEAS